MKKIIILSAIIACSVSNKTMAQANKNLSNLTAPTAVNVNLLPGSNNINLGSTAKYWNNIYFRGSLFYGKNRVAFVDSLTDCTAFGFKTLYSNSGEENTAIGDRTLYANTTGSYNTANGTLALHSNTSGSGNTANGYDALSNNTTGHRNTAIGDGTLSYNQTGNYNTALGCDAGVSYNTLSNTTAIGYGAEVNASNKVVIGNYYVTVIGGQVSWSTFSDGRFKNNVKQNVPGLAFINKLKPVTYNLELKKFDKFLGKKDSLINALKDAYARGEKKIHTGFIAQEVEKAAKELNYDFDGVNAPANDKDNYSIAYADFVPSLVKSVQELSAQNDSLKKQNDDQQKQIDELKAMMQQYMQGNATTSFSAANMSKKIIIPEEEAMLQQNVPNPVKNTTVINYFLPKKFANATVLITDSNGRALKQVSLAVGKGSVNIDASMFAPGIYNYSLIVDGKTIASKQMMRIK